MADYAVFLRAVNVGGTGKLPMAELRALMEQLGFEDVATYIQSGNVVFSTRASRAEAVKTLTSALQERMGKQGGVFLRTEKELKTLLDGNPFPDGNPSQVIVHFLNEKPPKASTLRAIDAPGGELIEAGPKALYVHYVNGQGRSKLKLPFIKESTARNVRTVQKMLSMLQAR